MATASALPLTGSNTSPAPVGLLRPGLRRMKSKGHAKRESPENIVTSWVQSPNYEDPLRILAPAQKKLSTVESQRILAVMDEATKRLELVCTGTAISCRFTAQIFCLPWIRIGYDDGGISQVGRRV